MDMLTDDELLRYSRQILLSEVDIIGQEKLKNSCVLIVGIGGLGSPVALYLAAAGIGHLILADFDRVDITNLQRQVLFDTEHVNDFKSTAAKERLQKLNPAIVIESITLPISEDTIEELVARADIVVDCCDNFLTRDLINQTCFKQNSRLVSGAAIRLQGQVTVFDYQQKDSPCYHCLYGEGSDDDLTCSEAGVLGPVVGIIGSIQALEVIKLLANFGSSLVGRLLVFDGLTSRFRELKIIKDNACKVCGEGYGK